MNSAEALAALRKAAVQKEYQYLIPMLYEKADFPYVIVKGEVLSCYAYGRPGQRRSGDIDILVDKKDLKKLESLLVEQGFTTTKLSRQEQIIARSFSHQVPPYRKELPLGALELDLNYDLLWGEWKGPRPQVSELLARRETMTIYGCEVPVLSKEDALIQVCLHHYKDMNSLFHLAQHNPITRAHFEDIAGFWKRQEESLNKKWLRDWMEQYELVSYFYYMLHSAAIVCGAAELEAWASTLKTSEGEALLEQFGLEEKERKTWSLALQERVDNPEVPQIVRGLLNAEDQNKIRQNQRIFGSL